MHLKLYSRRMTRYYYWTIWIQHMVPVFRELHLNAAFGNFGTACILCGVLVERTLQDLLPSKKKLDDLIAEAKGEGLLVGELYKYARRIQRDRIMSHMAQLSLVPLTQGEPRKL
jgi:hypothetical protein